MRFTKILGLSIVIFSAVPFATSCSPIYDDDYQRRADGLIDFSQEGFDKKYYPDLDTIKKTPLSGGINVTIVFDGRDPGYVDVAKEYMRIHPNVSVNINAQYTSDNYTDALDNNIGSAKPTWDIVQGNLSSKANTSTCMTLSSQINATNAYAGKKTRWKDVLEDKAYKNKDGTTRSVYMLNSESLETAWFINTVALKKAAEHGYSKVTETGEPANPSTWQELQELCAAMQAAGYKYPLGISLDKNSINSEQFTWLLRVYGDYYFRDRYVDITKNDGFEYDPTDVDFDANGNFRYYEFALYNLIFDEGMDYSEGRTYSGPQSDRFREFLVQLKKIGKFINPSAINIGFGNMRDLFASQTNNEAPQILLDYVGEAFLFNSMIQEGKFDYDFFDYPTMQPDAGSGVTIDPTTAVRDVGGNGGYLSVVTKGKSSDQRKLSADFLKFFMSPYGQSIYYHALNRSTITPKGITLVKNNMVVIPEVWKQLFKTEKVKFNGLADNNPFITYLIRNFSSQDKTSAQALIGYSSLMTNSNYQPQDFMDEWTEAINADWPEYCKTRSYDTDCWQRPTEQ